MKSFIDLHVHTLHSVDSQETIEAHCQKAGELGLASFAITDHCDVVNYLPLAEARKLITESAADARRMREHCAAEILVGVELGEPLEDLPYAEEILALEPYDVVLGSIHNAPGEQDFYSMDCRSCDVHSLMKPYFEELIRLAQWAQCDVIAHITYPLRYIEGDYGIQVDLTPYSDLIDELFRTIVAKGLALEVNTSGLRQKIARPLPDEGFLRRYYELGGRRLTFGSDAHTARDLGSGILQCQKMARRLGFTEMLYFRQRKAIAVALPKLEEDL